MFTALPRRHRFAARNEPSAKCPGEMTMLRYVATAALIYALAASAPASNASDVDCSAQISAAGVSTHVEGSNDFATYHGKVPSGLAKRRAIAAWQGTVTANCPMSSAKWWRAKAANVECEGAMGHDYCTASATPARKLMSLLSRH